MRRIGFAVLLSVFGLALVSAETGCVKRKGGLSKTEREALKDHVLDEMPANVPHVVDVNFDDKVHLLGWKADPEKAAPGSKVSFTLYWKKTGDLDPDWKLFTHITTDNTHEAKGNLDCVGAIRAEKGPNCVQQMFGPSEWEKGKIITDTFEFTVPADVAWPRYRFLVGIWKGESRLQIKDANLADDQNRANVISLETGVKPPPEPAPSQAPVPNGAAPKFGANTIKIDGKLDEPEWQKAAQTGPFVDPGSGVTPPASPVNASAKIGWDDQNLYFGFFVADKNATSPFKPEDKDPHIWSKASGVEMMIQPGDPGDNKDYYEIQVDSAGAVYDTHWDDFHVPETGGPDEGTKVFGHMDWASGIKAVVNVEKDKGYTVEAAIPWASFAKPRMVTMPPQSGDVWRINLYSFRDGQASALAWSPLLKEGGGFHKTKRFAKVMFISPGAMPGPSARPAVSGSGSAPASSGPVLARPGGPMGMHAMPMPKPN